MGIAERIAELEASIPARWAAVHQEAASIRGAEAELQALRAGVELGGGLPEMSRTEALLALLRRAGATMSPKELVDALAAEGRSDDMRSVTATLDHLLKSGSVLRPSRGRYLAV